MKAIGLLLMEIMHFEDMGGYECRLAANAVVLILGGYLSNINSNVPQWGIYPHIQLERDPLNIFWVITLTSSGSTGGHYGDAKIIISQNIS